MRKKKIRFCTSFFLKKKKKEDTFVAMLNKGVLSSPKQASGETPLSKALFTFSRSPSLIASNKSSFKIEDDSLIYC